MNGTERTVTAKLSELRILLMLATNSPQEVAYKLSGGRMHGRTIRAWMHRLAADLDAAGYNGDALRSLSRGRRRPRMILFSDLSGRDLLSARRQVSPTDLAPARSDPVRTCRSFRNLVFMTDLRRKQTRRYGGPPQVVQQNRLWRLRYAPGTTTSL